MNTNEKAAVAARLNADEGFKAVMSEIREDALSAFVNSAAGDTATREEAHALLRALSKVDGKLRAWTGGKVYADKKGQHRGSD